MANITADDLFINPDFYFLGIDGGQAVFAPMDRQSYHRSIFFDQRISAAPGPMVRAPLSAILQNMADRDMGEPKPICWILHVAHCGSTLLARALDMPDRTLVVREPMTLRQIGVLEGARASVPGQPVARSVDILRLARRMLEKRYDPILPVIVKCNVPVNCIATALMALRPEDKAIILHFGLDDYLSAILRSAKHRQWVSRVSLETRLSELEEIGDANAMTDAERAAALWLMQMRAFIQVLDGFPNSRSLDANALFDNPRDTLLSAASLFGIAEPRALVEHLLVGPLLTSYAKNPSVAFDNEQRLARRNATRLEIKHELEQAREWLSSRLGAKPLPERLPKALTASNGSLLSDA